MSMDFKYPDNKSFCTAPWVHLHVLPNGRAMPCCFWDQKEKRDFYGNINDYNTVDELMNHDNFKSLRNRFLEGKRHPGCSRCYQHEDEGRPENSMRYWVNETFDSPASLASVANTQEDGTIDPNVVYLDIRFGNICNLKCRMCGYELSSTWHEELIKLQDHNNMPKTKPEYQGNKPKFIHTDCYDKIEPLLAHVEEIYFAGGEPFLYPEHTKMLDKLIEIGNTNCRIKYNSNLSSLKYKGRDLIDIWKKFEYVSIGASIDAMGDTVEYIRTNLKWDKFKENFERVKTEAPEIFLFPAPTIGLLNMEVFPEFQRFYVDAGWAVNYPFVPNFVSWPEWQHPAAVPDWYKERVIKKYEEQITWLENHPLGKNQILGCQNIISYLRQDRFDEERQRYLIDQLWKRLWVFNETGNLNWIESLPHIWQFLSEYKQRNGWDKWPD